MGVGEEPPEDLLQMEGGTERVHKRKAGQGEETGCRGGTLLP